VNATLRERLTIGALQREATVKLTEAGIESAALDARVLLAEALDVTPGALLAVSGDPVSEPVRERFAASIKRRAGGEPVARILGRKEFWSRSFSLSPETLVPRPETETLVEAALAMKHEREAALRILDLGTGSGILLGALLLEYPNATGIGVDLDEGAVVTARGNLAALGVAMRGEILRGNWAHGLRGRFDIVVSNPPYVASGDIAGLQVEVRAHDPAAALDGGSDGLECYRAIIADLPRLLAPGGIAILELGAGQEGAVAEIARHAQVPVNGPARCDLSGHPRAMVLGPLLRSLR
jgi:release factor glutamine methyltransferase